jgi:hypothetical protein
MSHEAFWLAQAIIMMFVVFGMSWIASRAIHYYWTHPQSTAAEHCGVVAVAAIIVAVGNVFTTYATAVNWSDLRDFGGVMIRGALIIATVYMLVAGPLRQHRE